MSLMKLVLLMVCFPLSSWASTSLLTRVPEREATANNRLMADAGPLLAGGAGLLYERTLGRRWTFGPGVSFFKLNTDSGSFRSEAQVVGYGLHGRYFFGSAGAEQSGLYGLGGVQMVQMNVKGSFEGTQEGSKSDSSVGPLVGLGYQIVPKGRIMPANSLFNLGLTYGRGHAVKAVARSSNKGPTEITEVSAADSIFVEIALGMRF